MNDPATIAARLLEDEDDFDPKEYAMDTDRFSWKYALKSHGFTDMSHELFKRYEVNGAGVHVIVGWRPVEPVDVDALRWDVMVVGQGHSTRYDNFWSGIDLPSVWRKLHKVEKLITEYTDRPWQIMGELYRLK